MHIPKTAGIAVSDALVQAVRPHHVFFGFDRAFFGPFQAFDTVAPATRAFIHMTPATLPPREKLVRAHMSFTTLRAAYPDAQFLTVLREPHCRVLSHFLFWRGFSEAQMQEWGGWAQVMRLAQEGLAGLLADPRAACQIDNVAVRLLLWPHALIPDDGFIAPESDAVLVAEALAALRRFDHVGVQENPQFWPALEAWLGRPFQPTSQNTTLPLPDGWRLDLRAELTPDCQGLLQARTRLDQIVWADWLQQLGLDATALRHRTRRSTLGRLAKIAAPKG
jgi:hypothetical protein